MADPNAPSTPPKTHPGERLATHFDNFFKTVVGISTFGASLTFSKVVSNPVDPWHDYGFSSISVQYFLAHAFLFFVLDLVLTCFAASALTLYRPQAIERFGTNVSTERRAIMWYATVVSATLFGLLVVAFVFVALVVTAYAGPTGWVVIATTILFALLGFGVTAWQSPLFSASMEQAPGDAWEADLRIYGYLDEKGDPYAASAKREVDEYLGRRRHASGYENGDDTKPYDDVRRNDEGYPADTQTAGQYVNERPNWRPAVAHVPMSSGDHYYEQRRTSRYRRTSAEAQRYQYDDVRV